MACGAGGPRAQSTHEVAWAAFGDRSRRRRRQNPTESSGPLKHADRAYGCSPSELALDDSVHLARRRAAGRIAVRRDRRIPATPGRSERAHGTRAGSTPHSVMRVRL